jgi:hypothetical protein
LSGRSEHSTSLSARIRRGNRGSAYDPPAGGMKSNAVGALIGALPPVACADKRAAAKRTAAKNVRFTSTTLQHFSAWTEPGVK